MVKKKKRKIEKEKLKKINACERERKKKKYLFESTKDIGGNFSEVNGTTVNNLAAWDTVNTTWSAFGIPPPPLTFYHPLLMLPFYSFKYSKIKKFRESKYW